MSTLKIRRIPSGLLVAAVVGLLGQVFSQTAFAVALRTGNGNTTAPVDDPGFNYVGKSSSGNASIVYLGNQYAISAYHVSISASVQLRPTGTFQTYNIDPNGFGPGIATKRLKSSDNSNADLQIFRLTTDPGLQPLPIATTGPAVGDDVVMIGNGRDHSTDREWRIVVTNPNPPPAYDLDWFEVPPDAGPPDVAGFDISGRTLRWGENEVNQIGLFGTLPGYGTIDYFTTEFNDPTWYPGSGTLTYEAQAVNGDSGGGVFQKVGGQWYLAGLMHAQLTFDDQPSGTAVFGNGTVISDLSAYRSQILAYVPEPGSLGLLVMGAMGITAIGRRRRNAGRTTA